MRRKGGADAPGAPEKGLTAYIIHPFGPLYPYMHDSTHRSGSIHPLHMTHSQESSPVFSPKSAHNGSEATTRPPQSWPSPKICKRSLPVTVTLHQLGPARAYYLNTGNPPHCEQILPYFVGHIRVCILKARCRAQALCPAHCLGSTWVCLTVRLCKQK